MDPNFQGVLDWVRSAGGIPTVATVIVYLDLKNRVKRLEEKATDYAKLFERIHALELAQARLEGRGP
jgi:hypothetical protein